MKNTQPWSRQNPRILAPDTYAMMSKHVGPCLIGPLLTLVLLISFVPAGAVPTPPPRPAPSADERAMAQLKALPPVYPQYTHGMQVEPTHFRADSYLRAAVALQGLGRDRACRLLVRLARAEDSRHHNGQLFDDPDHDGYQPVVLCRMLFTAKPGGSFARPAIGVPYFLGMGTDIRSRVLGERTDLGIWPLEPITLVDGVPFLVCARYQLGDYPDDSLGYVGRCMHDDAWNPTPYRLKSTSEEEAALQTLLAAPVWHGDLSREDRAFLAVQLEPSARAFVTGSLVASGLTRYCTGRHRRRVLCVLVRLCRR